MTASRPGPRHDRSHSDSKRVEPPDARVARLAAKQSGVVELSQALGCGLSLHAVKRRLRSGKWHVIHRRVYAVGHAQLTEEGRFFAAVAALAPGAALSFIAAAKLWGFWRWPVNLPHVSVMRRARPRDGIVVHVDLMLGREDVTLHRGIWVTTPARTLLDLAAFLDSDRALRRAVGQAQVEKRVTHHELEAYVEAHPDHPGAARMAALVAPGAAPTRSDLEDETFNFFARHDLPRPEANATVWLDGRKVEVDFLFADLDLVVETDGGPYHDTPEQRVIDLEKQALLEAAGQRVLRVSDKQLANEELLTATRIARAVEEQRGRRGGVTRQ